VAQFVGRVHVEFRYLPMGAGSYLRFTNIGNVGELKQFRT